MYQPAHFNIQDPATLLGLIEQSPFGTWATALDGVLEMNHLPFLLDRERGPHGTLVGHVARANPVWKNAGASIVAFQGPQAYITPSWYPSKQEHGKAVPTWNYAVVQAHGQPRAIEDKAQLLQIVTRLTLAHEARQAAPWRVSDAPADFIDAMLSAIVGIEIPIERLVGKWKVSQNRSAADRQGVVAGLNDLGEPGAGAMAALVQQFAPK
jgi:transcriptional regulator